MTSRPVSAKSGDELANRLRRQYGQQLLDSLPCLPPTTRCTGELIAGYRRVTAALVRTARRHQGIDPRLITTRTALEADARAVRAVFDVVHRHLVACELAALVERYTEHDAIELVLVAERRVAELAGDIGDSP